MATGWRDAKKFKPDHEEIVLLWMRGDYHVGYWDTQLEGGHWWVKDCCMFDMRPSHWMELPKWPKGQKRPPLHSDYKKKKW